MLLLDGWQSLTTEPNASVTVGAFDGVHIGHQKILQLMHEVKEGPLTVVTFDRHPRMTTKPDQPPPALLTTCSERIALFERLQVDRVVRIKFDQEFALIEPERFVMDVLFHHIGMKRIYIGPNHRFGHNGSGNIELLNRLGSVAGFEVHIVQPAILDDFPVSSSRARQALTADGDVVLARRLLGRPYIIESEVVIGDQRGKTIGFPTANFALPVNGKLIPPPGVYAGITTVDGVTYSSVTHIGERPTFNASATFETFILDFDRDIYRKTIAVGLLQRIRGIMKYDSAATLISAITRDVEITRGITRDYFSHHFSASDGK